jgi:tetratricopeptide (TPR) repeat protein
MFVTPACNLKDCAPFKSQHAQGLSSRDEWTALYDRGMTLAKKGANEEALAAFDAAVQLDARFAELHYQRGKLLLQMGRLAEAGSALNQARDEDVCPLRAVAEITATVRRVAERLGAPLVDFENQIRNDCLRKYGHNIPGGEHFFSHVHPRIEFNRMLALQIVARLAAHNCIDRQATLTPEQIEQATTAITQRIDPVAHAVALRNMAKTLNWAGKHFEAGALALEALKTIPADPESLFLAAAYLQNTGDLDQAITYYRQALDRYPNAAEAHHRLGVALAEQDKLAEALPHFAEVVRLEPKDENAHYNLGRVLLEMGKPAEAAPHLRAALRLRRDHQAARESLNRALQDSQ